MSPLPLILRPPPHPHLHSDDGIIAYDTIVFSVGARYGVSRRLLHASLQDYACELPNDCTRTACTCLPLLSLILGYPVLLLLPSCTPPSLAARTL